MREPYSVRGLLALIAELDTEEKYVRVEQYVREGKK